MSIEELMAKYQSGGPKSRGKVPARTPIDSDDSSSEESDDNSELSDNISDDNNDDAFEETDNLKESFGLKSLLEEDSNKTISQVNYRFLHIIGN